MAIKTSTGLRNKMLDTGSTSTILNGGKVRIFAGVVPDTADAAETGTLLCELTVNSTGTGLTFAAAASGGVITKEPSEVWSGVNVATGTATYYRHVATGDDGTLSSDQARVQGTVGVAGADMNLSNTALVAGATQTLDYYSLALPTL
ncbi:MAG: hypothetical protein WBI41_05950 [Azovibrio sp.]|uniref:hypothetical protein n=1 Tax=Azovibrio sp. TaxID=1872673 RepID=UPI003C70AF06